MWWHGDSVAAPPSQQLSLRRVATRAEGGTERLSAAQPVGRYLTEALETLLGHVPEGVERPDPSRVRRAARARPARAGRSKARTGPRLRRGAAHPRPPEHAGSRPWRTSGDTARAWSPPSSRSSGSWRPSGCPRGRGRRCAASPSPSSTPPGPDRGTRRALRRGRRQPRCATSPAASEPAVILPFSRSGRPMLAKPDREIARRRPGLDAIGEAGRERILGWPRRRASRAACCRSSPARRAPASSRRRRAGRGRRGPQAWLAAAAAGALPAELDPRDQLERSLRVGCGELAADLALGTRPELAAAVPGARRCGSAGDGLDPAGWPRFRNLAREMERIAFGPPPVNGAKLLALIDCRPGRHSPTSPAASSRRPPPARRWVRRPARARSTSSSTPSSPARASQARIEPCSRRRSSRVGLGSPPDGAVSRLTATPPASAATAAAATGLAAVGRSTEDWVIDNDTLTRDRHPHLAPLGRPGDRRGRAPCAPTGADAMTDGSTGT